MGRACAQKAVGASTSWTRLLRDSLTVDREERLPSAGLLPVFEAWGLSLLVVCVQQRSLVICNGRVRVVCINVGGCACGSRCGTKESMKWSWLGPSRDGPPTRIAYLCTLGT